MAQVAERSGKRCFEIGTPLEILFDCPSHRMTASRPGQELTGGTEYPAITHLQLHSQQLG